MGATRNIYTILIIPFVLAVILGWFFLFTPKSNFAPNLIDIKLRQIDGKLSPQEIEMASIAWKYFENNYQPNTGLVNSVHGYPSTTMWDTSSYMAALVAAHQIGIIDDFIFDSRLRSLLSGLNTLKLFRDALPNKAYNTQTAAIVDYTNKFGEVGFSAIDIGRMLLWLKILKSYYPQYAEDIDNIVLNWNFCSAIDKCGNLTGVMLDSNYQIQVVQEGRLGYEEYAAKGFALWGFNTDSASRRDPYNYLPIYCVPIPYDTRDANTTGGNNYVTSESFVLDRIETGWQNPRPIGNSKKIVWEPDKWQYNFAMNIYEVQHRRFKDKGIITAKSEHQIDVDPYFIYDTIFANGYPWNVISEKGEYMTEVAAVSTKIAVGLWAIWDHDYSDVLLSRVSNLYDPKLGFYEGWYENSSGPIKLFTANNNGIILEALLYRKIGPLLPRSFKPSKWDIHISGNSGELNNTGIEKCHPMQSCAVGNKDSSCAIKTFLKK